MLFRVRGALAMQYIFFEMLPGFILGLLVFLSIILMFQVLRLTEFALVHGVDVFTLAEIIGYICISMLPALFPMSLLFSVLMAYGRLSNDAEIVAFKSIGINMGTILSPALALGVLVGVLSAQTTFEIAPWGNRQFEVLFTRLGNTKAAATIKPGTFSEGFFDRVIYANEVDSDHGHLKQVFIFDEQQGGIPLTIIAKEGQIIPDPERPGHQVLLRLMDGDIHRKGQNHTKIKFDSYDIKLVDPVKEELREKSPQSLTLNDLNQLMAKPDLPEEDRRTYSTEQHKRWAIAFLCPIFALLGVGLGTTTNRRQQRSSGLIVCLILIVVYWIIYLICEGAARGGHVPAAILWLPNVLYTGFALESLRKNWN